ncbi:hypothetical protein BH10PSE14_BH10PSE14_06870 [soil metagenome]
MIRRLFGIATLAAALWCAPAAAQKVSALPAATSPGSADKIPGIQGSGCATGVAPCTSVAFTLAQIATFSSASLDAKLVAIAGLSPSADTCFYFTSSTAVATYTCNTSFRAGSAVKWITGRTISITGDLAYTSPSLDGSANVTAAGTLATVNGNVGSFGGSTSIPSFTVNGKGLITAAAATTLTAATLSSSTVPCKSGVSASVTGTTTETTLATCTIPANAIGPNGQVEIQTLWSATNSANTKTFRAKFGGTAYYAAPLSTVTSLAAITRITNRNSASSQVGMASNTTAGFGQNNGTGVTTSAVDTTASVNIDFTAQLTNTGETITLESYLVRVTYGS